jgi:peptidoglycan/LPS O-acetylase OafA/YrhL
MTSRIRRVTMVLAGFVGVTAVLGGVELVTGYPVQQPVDWLAGTPFDSYVVPGLVLAALVGGSAVLALIAAIRSDPRWPRSAIVAGGVLCGWIVAEMVMLDQPTTPTVAEVVYLVIGALLVLLGWRATAAAEEPAEERG